METAYTFSPLKMEDIYDLCVVGGGLAGVMAAISAAREGCRVLLVEKYGFLGGMATAGLVYPFMPYYESGSGTRANAGLFQALQERIYALGGSGCASSAEYMEEFMKLALDRMLREAHVRVLLHAKLSDVLCTDGIVQEIVVATISGNLHIRAKYYIDATGNGDLCAFAGFPYALGRAEDGLCQPMTLCFRLGDVAWERIDLAKMQETYKNMQLTGELCNPRENILCFRMPAPHIMHLNTTRIVSKNPVDIFDYSAAEMEAREQVYEMYRFMREHVPGMENCTLLSSAPELGIRESRRICGHYTITKDDILQTRKFSDSIARGTYEIDIHNPDGSGTYIHRIPNNAYYTIPYRALVPVGSRNLLVAGRPISSTHEAHSALRIMPITTCIGEAAGAAVALAKQTDSQMQDVSTPALQALLIRHGALV